MLKVAILVLALGTVCGAQSTKQPAPPEKPAPGSTIQPTELEAAKLGKVNEQLQKCQSQIAWLQLRGNEIVAEQNQAIAERAAISQATIARIKKEQGVDVDFDQQRNLFLVATPPAPAKPDPKK